MTITFKFRKVEDSVEKDEKSGGAAVHERSPPPSVVLCAELEVAQDNCDLGTRYQEDNVGQQEEAENVVVLIHPQRAHDKEELNKARTEGEDASHQTGDSALEVPGLGRDLARDGGGYHGVLIRIHLVAKIRA